MSSSDSDSAQASSGSELPNVRASNRHRVEHDESTSNESSGDESSGDESSGDESSDKEESKFLDLEAEESDQDSSGSGDDSDHESSHMLGMNELPDREELYSFPQFARLPIELRRRIWDFVDPDLREPRRVFKFRLPISTTPRLRESELIERQTAPARALLSTHRESRDYALSFYPDKIAFESGSATVRYRKETDVIVLIADWELLLFASPVWKPLQSNLSQVRHVALEVNLSALDADIPQSFINRKILGLGSSIVPGLDAFYFIRDDDHFHAPDIKWCLTDAAHNFHLQTEELEEGLGEDLDYIFCWPDLTRKDELDIVRKRIDLADDGASGGGDDIDDQDEEGWEKSVIIHTDKVAMYPMIQFGFERGLGRFNMMERVNDMPGGWDQNWDPKMDEEFQLEEEGSELDSENEYESEGIDDEPIEDSDSDSDEDSDVIYHGNGPDGHGPDNFSGAASYMSAGSSPAQSDRMEALVTANFSDPESSDTSEQSSDEDADVDDQPARASKQRRRGAVPDSEDDSSSEDEAERSRSSHQQRRAVISDSDDDDEVSDIQQSELPKRRKRAVVSDSDDDEEISNVEQPQPTKRRKRAAMSDSDDDDDEQPEKEESRPSKRRKRVVMSESGSDDDDAAVKADPAPKRRKRIAVPDSDEDSADDSTTEQGSSDDSSESDQESSSEEDERPKKKPSLAERLHLFRSEVPTAPSPEPGSDADSDMAQLRNGDYDEPDAHSDDAADIDEMEEGSDNEAWDEAEGDSEGEGAW